ncbi:MAG: hypothetical protein ABSG51_04280 [Terracidiphilus sp.]|jgi:hypothetical protein
MKNITVSVNDKAYHDARVFAAKRDTSVSAIVTYVLQNLPSLAAFLRGSSLENPPQNPPQTAPAPPQNPSN